MGNSMGWTDVEFNDGYAGACAKPERSAHALDGEVPVFRLPEARRVKRHMCKHMKRKRFCRFGDACKFAHTRTELCIPLAQFYQRRNVRLRPVPT